MHGLRRLDDRLLLATNAFARHTGWLHRPALLVTSYGVVLLAALLLAGLVTVRGGASRRLAAAGWAGLAPLLAVAANQPLGRLVAEARPYTTHPALLVLAPRTADFSFPSDHAVAAGAAAAGLLLVSRRLGLAAAAVALLVGASRVYLGAHYPWDVAAGLALGAAVALAGWTAGAPALTLLARRLRGLPLVRAAFGRVVTTPPPSAPPLLPAGHA